MNVRSKILIGVGCLVAAIAYMAFMGHVEGLLTLNSDEANHALQVQDFLAGDFFMSDWHFTGVTFLTTDLLAYDVAEVLLGGVSAPAVFLAIGIMVALWVIVSLVAALHKNTDRWGLKVALFLLLAAIPSYGFLAVTTAHFGTACCGMLTLVLFADVVSRRGSDADGAGDEDDGGSSEAVNGGASDIGEPDSRMDDLPAKKLGLWAKRQVVELVLIAVLVFMGMYGDMLTLLVSVLPMLLFSLFAVLRTNDKQADKRYCVVAGVVIAACVIALAADHFYFSVGGADKNSFIGGSAFATVEEWFTRIGGLTRDLVVLFGADFAGHKLNEFMNVSRVANALVMLVALVVLVNRLYHFIKGDEVDSISVLVSLAIVLSICAYVFTALSTPRYLLFIPVGCVVLLVRAYDEWSRSVSKQWLLMVVALAVGVASFSGGVYWVANQPASAQNAKEQQLVDFLQEHGLHNGYSTFWRSSVLTVLSEQDVCVRHIKDYNGAFAAHDWFCKDAWYEEDTNFVILGGEDPVYGAEVNGVTEENVVRSFGEPSEVLECGQYKVLVYDHSLSDLVPHAE